MWCGWLQPGGAERAWPAKTGQGSPSATAPAAAAGPAGSVCGSIRSFQLTAAAAGVQARTRSCAPDACTAVLDKLCVDLHARGRGPPGLLTLPGAACTRVFHTARMSELP